MVHMLVLSAGCARLNSRSHYLIRKSIDMFHAVHNKKTGSLSETGFLLITVLDNAQNAV